MSKTPWDKKANFSLIKIDVLSQALYDLSRILDNCQSSTSYRVSVRINNSELDPISNCRVVRLLEVSKYTL